MLRRKGQLMFSFEEIYKELGEVIALKTLKSWAIKIEKVTDRKFQRRYAKNTANHTYSYKVFSRGDLLDFKQLILLRKEHVPLDEAIELAFGSEEWKKFQANKKELIEMKQDLKSLLELSKEIIADNSYLKQKLEAMDQR